MQFFSGVHRIKVDNYKIIAGIPATDYVDDDFGDKIELFDPFEEMR